MELKRTEAKNVMWIGNFVIIEFFVFYVGVNSIRILIKVNIVQNQFYLCATTVTVTIIYLIFLAQTSNLHYLSFEFVTKEFISIRIFIRQD